MQVDYVLILAAGKGTRMGNIGKTIPKVLWPVFEKSLLELEVSYANRFNPQKIFINLFHDKENLETKIREKKLDDKVVLVKENEVLDIGGAIHNIASQVDYRGKLLVINCDQFIILDDAVLDDFSKRAAQSDVCLLAYTVGAKDGYNALGVENHKLKEIIPKEKIVGETCETYTGMSCINLERIKPIQGESKFFESVANPQKVHVDVLNINNSKYWDFGTLKRYYNSMFSIVETLNESESEPFVDFLINNGAINIDKIGMGGYGAISDIIDLGINASTKKKTIYLSNSSYDASDNASIVFEQIEDLVVGID